MAQLDYTKYEGEGRLLCKFHQDMGFKNATEVAGAIDRKKADSVTGHYKTAEGKLSDQIKALYKSKLGIDPKSFTDGKLHLLNNKPSIVSYSYFKVKDKKNGYKNFLDAYFEKIIAEIKKAKKEIIVVDYLKTDFHIPKKSTAARDKQHRLYHDKYDSYLMTIEKAISENPGIRYRRYYQCPLSLSSSKIGDENAKRSGIDLIYRKGIEHFCTLWEREADFKARILTCPIQPSSYLIIDGKVLISEYIRYDNNGISKPDILFIEHKNSNKDSASNILIDSHLYRLQNIRDKMNPNQLLELTPEKLEMYYLQLKDDYENKLKKREIKNRDLTEQKLEKTNEKLKELDYIKP